MALETRIRLFGVMRIEVNGRPVDLGSMPASQILARVCLEPSRSVERTALAEEIWPDVVFQVSGNRLRTHLVHLKQALEPWAPLVSDRKEVAFADSNTDIDLIRAEHLVERLRIERDRNAERKLLDELVSLIAPDLLEGWQAEWVTPLRDYWIERRIETLLRLAQLAMEDDDSEGSLALVDQAIKCDEFRGESWTLWLRIMAKLGRGHHGVARFRTARQRIKAELGLDFGEEVVELARTVSRGAIGPSQTRKAFTNEERELLIGALERAAATDQNLLLKLYGSSVFFSESYRNPAAAFSLVNRTLEATDGFAPERVAATFSALGAGSLLDEPARKIELCEALIASPEKTPADHWRALSNLGFTYFELREWEKAEACLQEALAIAEANEMAGAVTTAKVQLASFAWHLNRFDEAEAVNLAAIAELEKRDDLIANHNRAANQTNVGFIMNLRRDWAGAHEWAEKGWRTMIVHGLDSLRHCSVALLGFSKIMLGETKPGCRLVIDGVTLCYANQSMRMHEISMDLAFSALAKLGHGPEALAAMEAYGEFRNRRRHGWSPGEMKHVELVRELAGEVSPNPAWIGLAQPEYVIRVCKLLESSATA
jgi:DNA-binding SARP family transcriptional activator